MDDIVFPGTLLGTVHEYTPSNNVYVKDSVIYSAILGNVSYSSEDSTKTSVSVVSNHIKTPYVGATVIAQIIKLNITKAECNIICVDGRFVKDYFKGVLSSNNVLESKNIEVFMYDWFKPGDFIKSKVIYAGEGKQFVLSTAGLQLGVIKTTSKNGEPMVPISWKYFMSVDSKSVEKRKVAKND
ncbi:3'-5' exoribonuclease [Theileria orientalis strain Shintoku]|uniref:3'-5' exoribonuclease n=1 Tax=Theileria orientalis strain Shintoku TaxID=869250 RepID=J4D5A6_THEOR|nr:3'-5' exoribonuclease [Theileria orientalis strain Shintoku]PVC52351.1 3'-5' exoribonuclease [Theileria orientalis]BAM38815.1 3'-5' exoribonuclease [Theileria orientalis strain Shintoku]|eukprot:XP_009689116.1 3'-5' exoribonuclease [Theileria orientalis strain Shintoku]